MVLFATSVKKEKSGGFGTGSERLRAKLIVLVVCLLFFFIVENELKTWTLKGGNLLKKLLV